MKLIVFFGRNLFHPDLQQKTKNQKERKKYDEDNNNQGPRRNL